MLNYLANLGLNPKEQQITLLHVLIRPKAEQALMGKKYSSEQEKRITDYLEKAKTRLTEIGFLQDQIKTTLLTEPFTTVADGIIDHFNRESYDMVMIGRKKMSKSEEFVLGDVSIKLVRALSGTAIVVVKS